MEASIKRLKRIYYDIKSRCLSPSNASYDSYGGKGVKMCEEWLNSIDTFIVWSLSHGYSDKFSLNRINSNGDYEPNNCKWISPMVLNNTHRNYWLIGDHPEFTGSAMNEEEKKQVRDNIKDELSKNALTRVWLINRLKDEGLMTDKTELSSVLSGSRIGAKADAILYLSKCILTKYIDTMA